MKKLTVFLCIAAIASIVHLLCLTEFLSMGQRVAHLHSKLYRARSLDRFPLGYNEAKNMEQYNSMIRGVEAIRNEINFIKITLGRDSEARARLDRVDLDMRKLGAFMKQSEYSEYYKRFTEAYTKAQVYDDFIFDIEMSEIASPPWLMDTFLLFGPLSIATAIIASISWGIFSIYSFKIKKVVKNQIAEERVRDSMQAGSLFIANKNLLWLPFPFLLFGLSGEFAPNLVALVAYFITAIIFSIYEVFKRGRSLWMGILIGGGLLSSLSLFSKASDYGYEESPIFLGIVLSIYYIVLWRRKAIITVE